MEHNHSYGPQIIPLDIDTEEEVDSLMRETNEAADTFIPPSGRKRFDEVLSRRKPTNTSHASTSSTARILGLLRTNVGNGSAIRAFGFVAGLGLLTLLLTEIWDRNVEHLAMEHSQERSHHGPSLGGAHNPGHYDSNDAIDMHDDSLQTIDDQDYLLKFKTIKENYNDDALLDQFILPQSNVGTKVISRSNANTKNHAGHFLHDPLKSPFASPLYMANSKNRTRKELLQKEFDLRMNRTITHYGKWTTPKLPPGVTTHEEGEILKTPLKDYEHFSESSWQGNSEYLADFLKEAKDLVSRVKEGIYEEYGYGLRDARSNREKEEITARRLEEFRIIVGDDLVLTEETFVAIDEVSETRIPGVAYLTTAAWEGLVRKLLHAMMTQDDFFVVSVGQLETFVSNNFFQSSVMQFNYIMEPVFDKLGMRLLSRNMGMDASTTVSALGGADIYGEADIFLYLGEHESEGMMDFLHRQSILAGARVPILLSPLIGPLMDLTDSGAWVGNLQPGATFCEETVVDKDTQKLLVPHVKACRYVVCSIGIQDRCDKHNSVCWIDRTNQNQEMAEQDDDVGETGKLFPNYNVQKLEGRKIAMLVLEALDEAISRWNDAVSEGNLPLSNELWHVGKVYDDVREKVRETRHTVCEKFMRKIDPRLCHVEMHVSFGNQVKFRILTSAIPKAFTEWTPRVHPHAVRLKHQVVDDRTIADNHEHLREVYHGVDLLPIKWMPIRDDVDVHMIAIAADVEHMQEESALNANSALDRKYEDTNDDDHIFVQDDDGRWMDGEDNFYDDYSGRSLYTDDFSSNDEWTVYNAPIGFCDGSAQARCHRAATNTCLLSGHNFYQAGIMAHGHSGKLRLSIPNVVEGIILARFDWRLDDGPRVKNIPHDFTITFTVDGKSVTHGRQSFANNVIGLVDDLFVHVLLLDENMLDGDEASRDIEVEIEAKSHIQGDKRMIMLSHIYYA